MGKCSESNSCQEVFISSGQANTNTGPALQTSSWRINWKSKENNLVTHNASGVFKHLLFNVYPASLTINTHCCCLSKMASNLSKSDNTALNLISITNIIPLRVSLSAMTAWTSRLTQECCSHWRTSGAFVCASAFQLHSKTFFKDKQTKENCIRGWG